MDYEKEYKAALERASIIYTTKYKLEIAAFCKQTLEAVFPELKNYSDMRIIKEITFFLKQKDGYNKDWINWLENLAPKPQGKSALEAINEEPIDNANKVEPKFNVGDWVSNGRYTKLIVGINSEWPDYMFDDGTVGRKKDIDKIYHLWTIQDAKDGDVLVSRSPFIYGKQCPYGGLNWNNNNFIKASNFIFTDSPVHPATKEQSDLLFKKLKEAGYEWDFEKKELR